MLKRIGNWWRASPDRRLDLIFGTFVVVSLGVLAIALLALIGLLLLGSLSYLWRHFNSISAGVGSVIIFFGAGVALGWLLGRSPKWVIPALLWTGIAAVIWWAIKR